MSATSAPTPSPVRFPPRMVANSPLSATHPSRPTWAIVAMAWTAFGVVHGDRLDGGGQVSRGSISLDPSGGARGGVGVGAPHPPRLSADAAHAPSRVGWAPSLLAHAVAAIACAALLTWWRRLVMSYFANWTPEPFLPTFVYWFDVWLFVYASLVVVGHALSLRRRYVDRTVRAHLLEAQLARAQLQFLELQLQPHFLFNALNAIQELAHEAPQAAERMLRRLHALLSISLERSGRDEVTLGEECRGAGAVPRHPAHPILGLAGRGDRGPRGAQARARAASHPAAAGGERDPARAFGSAGAGAGGGDGGAARRTPRAARRG